MECCSICLSDEEVGQWHTISCGHAFHTDCIVRWLRSNPACPVCRDSPHAPSPKPDAMQEAFELRRRYRNYINRRNRLARENPQVGSMRAVLRKTQDSLSKQRRILANATQNVERQVATDPSVIAARKGYKNARRKHARAQAKFASVTESLLGPEPPAHLFGIFV